MSQPTAAWLYETLNPRLAWALIDPKRGDDYEAIVAAIAAHVAAEVAAERARCVVPEVVRRGIRYAINSTRYIGAAELDMSAWLASLPPITPEGT